MIKHRIFKSLLIAAVVAFGSMSTTKQLSAQVSGAINAPSAAPSAISVNTPSIVTVTVTITDPALIPNSVTLLRLGGPGTQPINLGKLHDDGKDGDTVAGDHIYTIQFSANEQTAGQIQLQVSAALQGRLRRVVSPPVAISVH